MATENGFPSVVYSATEFLPMSDSVDLLVNEQQTV